MAIKQRNLYLYLTLLCFFGLIAIFIVDGYMGVYDTVYVTAGEREQKIESDVWLREDKFWSSGVNREEKAFFRYEVDNRRFSGYTADIEASLWRSQEKVQDLISQPISIDAFDKGQLEWVIDTTELVSTCKSSCSSCTLGVRRLSSCSNSGMISLALEFCAMSS